MPNVSPNSGSCQDVARRIFTARMISRRNSMKDVDYKLSGWGQKFARRERELKIIGAQTSSDDVGVEAITQGQDRPPAFHDQG